MLELIIFPSLSSNQTAVHASHKVKKNSLSFLLHSFSLSLSVSLCGTSRFVAIVQNPQKPIILIFFFILSRAEINHSGRSRSVALVQNSQKPLTLIFFFFFSRAEIHLHLFPDGKKKNEKKTRRKYHTSIFPSPQSTKPSQNCIQVHGLQTVTNSVGR